MKIKSKKDAQYESFKSEDKFIRKAISLNTETDQMLKEICEKTGAGQSSVIRQMIIDLHKKISKK